MKKYLKADLIYTILSNKFKDELDNYPTALRREKKFKYYLEMVKPKIALEIGTCSGMSAALIAMYAEKVYTIDTQNYPISKEIWEYLGIFEKIVPYVIGTEDRNGEKEKIVKTLEFDFAYIDGAHHYESVKFDFDLVKNKCKKILFDDYNYPTSPGVTKFLHELNGISNKILDGKNWFAYVEL